MYETAGKSIGYLTGNSGNAINLFLAAWNPFINSSIISLNHRNKFIQGLGILYNPSQYTIGEQIVKTNVLIYDFFNDLGFSPNARTISYFAYHSDFRNIWNPPKPVEIKSRPDIDVHKIDDPVKAYNVNSEIDKSREIDYWWINANPKYWNIDNFEIGQEQSYTTHNETGNKRRIYEYFKKLKPGDLIIGYQSTPSLRVKALFEVTSGASINEEGKEEISFIIKEFFPYQVTWEELKKSPKLLNCEVFTNNQGSLFSLRSEEFNEILALCKREKKIIIQSYQISDALKEIFLDQSDLRSITDLLEYKKNIILQGPPGTGKTFVAKRLAFLSMGQKDYSKIEMIQFHQSYSYEDFIQGFRPSEDGKFYLQNGVFYNFCKRAERDPSGKYFFIIDEINRGNLSKIFGELMMLIENDKRGHEHSLKLAYSSSMDMRFSIPSNLYIIGTMNTADRSLAIVDYALRRRFAFVTILPAFSHSGFRKLLSEKGIKDKLISMIINRMNDLNSKISADDNLRKSFSIGHSYFCSPPENADESWYRQIINNEIGPLLSEYWFDDEEKAEEQKLKLLRD